MKNLIRSTSDTNLNRKDSFLNSAFCSLRVLKKFNKYKDPAKRRAENPKPNTFPSDSMVIKKEKCDAEKNKGSNRKTLEGKYEFYSFLKAIFEFKRDFEQEFITKHVQPSRTYFNLVIEAMQRRILKFSSQEGVSPQVIHLLEQLNEILTQLSNVTPYDLRNDSTSHTIVTIRLLVDQINSKLLTKNTFLLCSPDSIVYLIKKIKYSFDFYSLTINTLVENLNKYFTKYVEMNWITTTSSRRRLDKFYLKRKFDLIASFLNLKQERDFIKSNIDNISFDNVFQFNEFYSHMRTILNDENKKTRAMITPARKRSWNLIIRDLKCPTKMKQVYQKYFNHKLVKWKTKFLSNLNKVEICRICESYVPIDEYVRHINKCKDEKKIFHMYHNTTDTLSEYISEQLPHWNYLSIYFNNLQQELGVMCEEYESLTKYCNLILLLRKTTEMMGENILSPDFDQRMSELCGTIFVTLMKRVLLVESYLKLGSLRKKKGTNANSMRSTNERQKLNKSLLVTLRETDLIGRNDYFNTPVDKDGVMRTETKFPSGSTTSSITSNGNINFKDLCPTLLTGGMTSFNKSEDDTSPNYDRTPMATKTKSLFFTKLNFPKPEMKKTMSNTSFSEDSDASVEIKIEEDNEHFQNKHQEENYFNIKKISTFNSCEQFSREKIKEDSNASFDLNSPLVCSSPISGNSPPRNLPKEKRKSAVEAVKIVDFTFIRALGKGGYGRVDLYMKKTTGDYFAIKSVEIAMMREKNISNIMKKETNILNTIKHKNIVKCYYIFNDEMRFYFVMEYLPGGDLLRLLNTIELPENVIQVITAEIILALEYLHMNSIIHRDIKPENIVIASDGHFKLTDFGISDSCVKSNKYAIVSSDEEGGNAEDAIDDPSNGVKLGTENYMAPEMFRECPLSSAVDYWALGVLLYELYTFKLPFMDKSHSAIKDNITNLRINWSHLEEEHLSKYYKNIQSARNLIEKLLVLDPSERWGSWNIEQIKFHPFFKGLDWGAVQLTKLPSITKYVKQLSKELLSADKNIKLNENISPILSADVNINLTLCKTFSSTRVDNLYLKCQEVIRNTISDL